MATKLKIEKKGDEILIGHCCFSVSHNEKVERVKDGEKGKELRVGKRRMGKRWEKVEGLRLGKRRKG
jgi:hypothetical protein